MNVSETLEALRARALSDPALRNALLATREHPDALTEFCRISTQAGLPLYDMDIIEYGEYAYASMKRRIKTAISSPTEIPAATPIIRASLYISASLKNSIFCVLTAQLINVFLSSLYSYSTPEIALCQLYFTY